MKVFLKESITSSKFELQTLSKPIVVSSSYMQPSNIITNLAGFLKSILPLKSQNSFKHYSDNNHNSFSSIIVQKALYYMVNV